MNKKKKLEDYRGISPRPETKEREGLFPIGNYALKCQKCKASFRYSLYTDKEIPRDIRVVSYIGDRKDEKYDCPASYESLRSAVHGYYTVQRSKITKRIYINKWKEMKKVLCDRCHEIEILKQ